MYLGLEEVDSGTILVVSDRGLPIVIPSTVEGLPIQFHLDLVDMSDSLVQLMCGDVQLNKEQPALS